MKLTEEVVTFLREGHVLVQEEYPPSKKLPGLFSMRIVLFWLTDVPPCNCTTDE
jgi:hypothetical protein